MSITEAVIQKMNALPPEKQEQVLHYVEALAETPRAGKPYSSLHLAASLNLDGPADWSARFEEYLRESRAKNAGS